MNDDMFKLDIFRESTEERSWKEFIARKKKEIKGKYSGPGFVDLGDPLKIPFGPQGMAIMEARIRNGLPRAKKGLGIPILGTTLFIRERDGKIVTESVSRKMGDKARKTN